LSVVARVRTAERIEVAGPRVALPIEIACATVTSSGWPSSIPPSAAMRSSDRGAAASPATNGRIGGRHGNHACGVRPSLGTASSGVSRGTKLCAGRAAIR